MKIMKRSALTLPALLLLVLSGCATTGTPATTSDTEAFIAQGLGVAAVQNYLKAHPDGVPALSRRLDAAQTLLIKGATFADLKAAVFEAVPQQDLAYAVVVLGYVEARLPAGTGVIDPKSQAGLIIQGALDGAKLAVSMAPQGKT